MTTAQPTPPQNMPLLGIEAKPAATQAVRIEKERVLEAAGALVAEVETDRRAGGKRFVEAAREHGLDISNLWGVLDESGQVRHAALSTPGSGRTHMCFTSPVKTDLDANDLAVALNAACSAIGARGLAQSLLEPSDTVRSLAYERAGFRRLATLGYLRRRLTKSRASRAAATRHATLFADLPPGVRVENWRPGMDSQFISALEASYADTLDCPELCGLRDTGDVLESHKVAGEFHPSLWWLVRDEESRPAGAMLFSPSQQHTHIELVYLGLAPSLRGKGLARVLLDAGLRALERRPERVVTCAVDQRNEPARRLYRRAGFEQFAERVAYIRPVG